MLTILKRKQAYSIVSKAYFNNKVANKKIDLDGSGVSGDAVDTQIILYYA